MKKIATIFLCCFLALASACTPKEIIPKKKMASINADFFLMDQYLGADRTMRKFSDTTAVYKPVLKYYGYTADEYFASVDYYLENSRDMAKILEMTEKILRKRQKTIMKRIEADSRKVDTTTTNFF
ncbi:MAG: DUF4296 domain-containing protein [Bacteroidales bacterium]|nr:DUF4296 domain-containing protein [Bacteroidales bacterium]